MENIKKKWQVPEVKDLNIDQTNVPGKPSSTFENSSIGS